MKLKNARLPTLQTCRVASTLIQSYQHSAPMRTLNWWASELVQPLNVFFPYLLMFISIIMCAVCVCYPYMWSSWRTDLGPILFILYMLPFGHLLNSSTSSYYHGNFHNPSWLPRLYQWLDVSNSHLSSDITEVLMIDRLLCLRCYSLY